MTEHDPAGRNGEPQHHFVDGVKYLCHADDHYCLQAAEQRGRQAALREAADCLMKRYGVTNRAAGDLHLMAMEHLINRGKS